MAISKVKAIATFLICPGRIGSVEGWPITCPVIIITTTIITYFFLLEFESSSKLKWGCFCLLFLSFTLTQNIQIRLNILIMLKRKRISKIGIDIERAKYILIYEIIGIIRGCPCQDICNWYCIDINVLVLVSVSIPRSQKAQILV